jgi:hypothetical protein
MSYGLCKHGIGSIYLYFHERRFSGFYFRTENLDIDLTKEDVFIVEIGGLTYRGSFHKLRLDIEKILPQYDEETEDFRVKVEHTLELIWKVLNEAIDNGGDIHCIQNNLEKVSFRVSPVKSARKI